MGSAPEQNVDALLEDYKLKSAFASEHLGRMQTQFQVMLTLQTALATALIVSNTGNLTDSAKWGVLLEVALSIAWLFVGYRASERAEMLRNGAKNAEVAWTEAAKLDTEATTWTGPSIVMVAVLAPAALTVGWIVIFLKVA